MHFNYVFIDATEGEVADEGDITIPDALLFNDSLDEGVDPTALLDDGVLPTECAAAEPKPGNVSQKELNDSLNAEDLDETQLPVNDDDLTQATVEKEVATSMKPTAVEPQSDRNKEQRKLAPKVNSSLSIEKKANANLEEKKLASTTEPQASKAMAKVRPSFGKKKKGFTPPKTVTKAAPNVTDQSKSNTQPVKTSDQNSSNKSTPQSSPKKVVNSAKLQPANNTGSELKTTSENMPSTEEKKAKGPDKMRAEEKKREKEKKEQERALKKQALEQKKMEREKKKAELEHQRNEKRLELEQKKAEREQKKMEKELKKMEKEQKKAEKQQTKASQKKQQIKDKKTEDTSTIEESIKKDDNKTNSEKSTCMEEKGRDTVNEGTDETNIAVKSAELETDKVEKENIPPIGEKQSSVASTKDAVAPLSPVASCDDKTKKQKEKLSPQMKDDDQQKSEVGVKEKENIPAKEAGNSDVSDHEELAKTTPAVANSASSKSTELNRDRTTKQKEKKLKKFSPPKAKESSKEVKKQRKPVIKLSRVEKSSGAGGDGNKKTQAGKEMKRKCSVYSDSEDELEPKRAKPIDHLGSVWVQCENANCKKWRLLRECDDPAKVPGKWVCSMNTDPDHNSCSAEEERWSDLGDSQEFVESPFIPGSLVWSKMDGYPW